MSFLILLSGDIETQPGPVTPACKTRSAAANSTDDDKTSGGIEKLAAGQSAICKALDEIMLKLDRLDKAIKEPQNRA